MRGKKAFINSGLGIIFLIILTIIGFFSSRVFVLELGLEYNGLNGLFQNILSVLAITELGIGGAVTYNLYKPIHDNDIKKISGIMKFYQKAYTFIGCLIFGLSLILTFFIHHFVSDTTFSMNYIRGVFLLFAFSSSISYFFSYNRNLFYAYQKNYVVLISDFIIKTIKIVLQILSLYVWKSYIIYLLINLTFSFGTNLIIHFLAKKHFPKINTKGAEIDKEVSKEVFSSVKNLALIQIMSVGITSTDNIIISSFIGISTVGLYYNYSLIISQLFQVITTFFSGIGASIGNLITENNKDRIKEIFINLDYLSFFIGSYVICSLFFIAQVFISWLYGPEFLLPVNILAVLCVNFYIQIKRQAINYFYFAGGHFKKFVLPNFIEAVLNIVLSIILVLKFNLLGVFIGTFVSSLISWGMSSKIFHEIYNMGFSKYVLRQIIFILILLFEFLLIKGLTMLFIPSNLLISIIYLVSIGLIIPNVIALIILFKSKNTEYLKEFLLKILAKLKVIKPKRLSKD